MSWPFLRRFVSSYFPRLPSSNKAVIAGFEAAWDCEEASPNLKGVSGRVVSGGGIFLKW